MIVSAAIPSSMSQVERRKRNDWLYDHGIQACLPFLSHVSSYNMGLMWDDRKGKMRWNAAAIAEAARFDPCMVYHYNDYYYRNHPEVLRWTLAGEDTDTEINQDDILPPEMVGVMARQKAWMEMNGIEHPWILIDEPPPSSSERWSSEVESRIMKFAWAAKYAGFETWVAVPGPSQLAYWIERIEPIGWYVGAKNAWLDFNGLLDKTDADIGLYNRVDTFAGLAQQMQAFGAERYLHWTVEHKELPIMNADGTPTDEAQILVGEIGNIGEIEEYPEVGLYMLALGEEKQAIQLNPAAALQKRIFADGFVPTSAEFDGEYFGETWVGQRAEHLHTGVVRVYFAPTWDYNRVEYIERPQ